MYKYIFIILHFTSVLFAQNYLWPTNASKNLTSSFCEYRPGHYHAALDIKTWNKEGYKCFAVEDGFIERIKISPHGAGKALYIKLKDGRKAVYFHLQKFNDKLENKIREIQLAQKSYSIEWWPKNWQVKKGDLVAYTGQTGIGVPHLHFEIRDASNRPLNPLQFYNDVKDNIRPQLKRLLVIPQDRTSRVNGSFLPAAYDLTYIHDGVFILKDDICASGKIGLALNGYDMADGVNNKFAWYHVKMTVNGQKVFEYAYDRVSFSQSRYVDVDIYYPEKRNSGRSYNKLYLESHNILDFYNRDLGDGLINISDNKVPFEVEVKDYFGNTSFLKGMILPETNQQKKPENISAEEENVLISMYLPDNLKNINFLSGKNGQVLHNIDYFEIVKRQQADKDSTTLLKVRLATAGDNIIQAIIENTAGIKDTSFVPLIKPHRTAKMNVNLMGRYLYCTFQNLVDSETLEVRLVQKNYAQSYPIQPRGDITEFVIPANDIDSDTIRLLVKDERNIYLDSTLTIFKMIPGQAALYSLFSDSMQINVGPANAFDTLLFMAGRSLIDRTIFKLPVLSDAFYIDAGKHILNRNVDVSVKIQPNAFKPQQLAFYEIDGDELDYEGGSYSPQTGFVSDRQRNFSEFVIAADTVAPDIDLINFKANGAYKNVSSFRFKVNDQVSGIGTDKNISIYLNDQYLIPEWDPETDIVKGIVHYKPSPGQYKVTITCRDRAGNTTEKIIPVQIL